MANHIDEHGRSAPARSTVAKRMRGALKGHKNVARVEETKSARYTTKLDPKIKASAYVRRMSDLRRKEPRPVHKLWRDPSSAPAERVAAAHAAVKKWRGEYSKVSKNQKAALERDNAAFRARNQ